MTRYIDFEPEAETVVDSEAQAAAHALGEAAMAPFAEVLDEVRAANEAFEILRNYQGRRESPEGRQNKLNLEIAQETEQAAREQASTLICATDDSTLTKPQKVIATHVLRHVWRPSASETILHIGEGFQVLDRIIESAESMRGTVLVAGEKEVGLYDFKGTEHIVGSLQRGHDRGIDVVIPDGKKVALKFSDDKSFPDAQVEPATFIKHILGNSWAGYPAEQMQPFDPTSEQYMPPFTALGTPEHPLSHIDDYLLTDAYRFAGRMLVMASGKQDWLLVTPPSENLKVTVINRVSDVYVDVVTGAQPRDRVGKLKTTHSSLDFGTSVTETFLRSRSLGELSAIERKHLLYAADVSPDAIEDATREKVAKLSEGDTAVMISNTLRTDHHLDRFFARLREVDELA